MERKLKEITEVDLDDFDFGFGFKPKKENKKVNTVKVNNELYNKLNDYRSLSPSDKGAFLEDIVKHILTRWGFEFLETKTEKMQKYWGDLIIMDSKKDDIKVDVKGSTTYKGEDKLSMDFEYYKKGSYSPYIPQGADNNFGYLRYLEADMIISINAESKRLYIIKEFKKLSKVLLEEILYLELEGKDRGNDIIDISMNKRDKYKDTKMVSIAFTNMKKLGVDVRIYDIIEQDSSVGSTRVS